MSALLKSRAAIAVALVVGTMPISSSAIPIGPSASAETAVVLKSGQAWPEPWQPTRYDGQRANGVIALRGLVKGARINAVLIENAYRALETADDAKVSDLVIDGLKAFVYRACIHVDGDRLTIRNVRCVMIDGPESLRENMPAGLHLTSGSDIEVSDSSFDGFQWTAAPDRYWNGEGVAAEAAVAGLTIRNVSATNNTDAGFDLKPFVRMTDVFASGNCRNFRLWAGAEIGILKSGDVTYRGGNSSCSAIWINGSFASVPHVRIKRFVAWLTRPATLIEVDTGPAIVEIDSCDIKAPRGSKLVELQRGGETHFGPGCHL